MNKSLDAEAGNSSRVSSSSSRTSRSDVDSTTRSSKSETKQKSLSPAPDDHRKSVSSSVSASTIGSFADKTKKTWKYTINMSPSYIQEWLISKKKNQQKNQHFDDEEGGTAVSESDSDTSLGGVKSFSEIHITRGLRDMGSQSAYSSDHSIRTQPGRKMTGAGRGMFSCCCSKKSKESVPKFEPPETGSEGSESRSGLW